MKVLLTGASGFLGRRISEALATAGHEVAPISRAQGINVIHLQKPEDWLLHLHGIDAVINCVGIIVETRHQSFAVLHYHAPVALFQACVQSGVRRVIQISALGADAGAFTPYQLSKKAADDVLRSLPLEWFILRPSLIYDQGGKSTQLFQRLARLPLIPLVGQGQQLIQPVHCDDVVAAVMTCLTAQPAQQTIDIVGPQVVTFLEWLHKLRAQAGKPVTKTFPVPFSCLLAISRLARYAVPLINPDNLRMLHQGNCADVQPLTRLLGRLPRVVP